MPPLELLFFISFGLACVLPLYATSAHWRLAALCTPLLFALLHWGLVGYRWQVLPAYGVALLLAAWGLYRYLRLAPVPPLNARTIIGANVRMLFSLTLLVPTLLFPIPSMPAINGPHQVGTVAYQWVDATRLELYTDDPSDTRRLMVQFWYPATPAADAKPGPWMDRLDIVGPTVARYLRLPSFILDHASYAQTNSYQDAPLAHPDTPYPIVIYSHGWNGFRTINMNQLEALASRGFVVVAIDHTYGAMVTVFDDGQVALNNPAALPDGPHDEVWKKASETLEATYAADIRFVMDELAKVQQGDIATPLAGQLDLDRIGVFGHSTGGGATAIACAQDPRCKAALGQDLWAEPVPPAILAQGLSQPLLLMDSETWSRGVNRPLLDELTASSTGPRYHLIITGTKHYDFTLIPLLSPLTSVIGLKGPLPGPRTLDLVTAYTVAFFEQHLQNTPSALLAGPSPDYPEVTFVVGP